MANIVQCGATLKKVLAKPSHFQFQDVPVGEHLPVTPNGSLKEVSQVSPPKRARAGEIQPHFVSASFRHAQWLRQGPAIAGLFAVC